MTQATTTATFGVEASPEELLGIWEAAAGLWSRRRAPWRPTAGDVAVYRRLAGHRLGGRVLIMGVTPELRDLVALAGGRAVLADMSEAMYAATTAMLQHADPAREERIVARWDEAPLPEDAFDLVLGDMLWWAIPISAQETLRDAVRSTLSPDGIFLSRFRFSEPRRALEDPVGAVRRHLERLDSDPEAEIRVRGSIVSWIYDHTANHAGRRLDVDRARRVLLELAARVEGRHETFLRDIASLLSVTNWTCQSREELLELVGTRFEVADEEHAEDYDSSLYPILALRPI